MLCTIYHFPQFFKRQNHFFPYFGKNFNILEPFGVLWNFVQVENNFSQLWEPRPSTLESSNPEIIHWRYPPTQAFNSTTPWSNLIQHFYIFHQFILFQNFLVIKAESTEQAVHKVSYQCQCHKEWIDGSMSLHVPWIGPGYLAMALSKLVFLLEGELVRFFPTRQNFPISLERRKGLEYKSGSHFD